MNTLQKILHFIYFEFFVEKDVRVQNKIFTWPNLITVLGMFGIAFYVFQFTTQRLEWLIPITVFLIGLSDLLDGYVARRLDQHTKLGKFIDPMRDKLLGIALCLNIFLIQGDAALVPLLIWIFCDIAILFQDIWYSLRKIVIKVHTVNKTNQALKLLCIGVILFQEYWFYELIPAIIILWIIAIIAMINGIYVIMQDS